MKVNSVRISAIAHATEDVSKVTTAISQLFGLVLLPSEIEKTRLKGHYGNEIAILTTALRGVSAEYFFHQVWGKLARADRMLLIESLETRIDNNGRLYLRLEKQAAFLGIFRLEEQDPIKLEISFKEHQGSPQDQLPILRRMLQSDRIQSAKLKSEL